MSLRVSDSSTSQPNSLNDYDCSTLLLMSSTNSSHNNAVEETTTQEEEKKRKEPRICLLKDTVQDEAMEESIEDIYRLDYEQETDENNKEQGMTTIIDTESKAAGGEILKPGDHVYFWCSLGTYQHHGIVLQTDSCSKTILIAEFTNAALAQEHQNWLQSASVSSQALSEGIDHDGGFRLIVEDNPSQWHVVKYQAHWAESLTWRAGTCSGVTPDPVDRILQRVRFLADCRHLIPNYHVLSSNCETMAVWCTTGRWTTLQGDHALNVTKVGTGVLAMVEATTSMLVVPVVGVAAGAAAVWHSIQIGQKWQTTTELLNKEFQWYIMGNKECQPPWRLDDFKRDSLPSFKEDKNEEGNNT